MSAGHLILHYQFQQKRNSSNDPGCLQGRNRETAESFTPGEKPKSKSVDNKNI